MAGGLMQLVAYGAQDVYLTGNPKVTFFQAVYKLFFFSSVTFSLKSAKLKNSLILSLRSRAQIGVTDKRRDDAPPPPRESFE